jgi:hypothetical protein
MKDFIGATFKNRGTPIPAEGFEALTANFADQHRAQWNAFVRKMGEDELTDAFGKVVTEIRIFALPLLRSLARSERLVQQWKAGNGWVPR